MVRQSAQVECGWCRKLFVSMRAKFCSDDCRQKRRASLATPRPPDRDPGGRPRKVRAAPPEDDSDLPDPPPLASTDREEYEGTCHLCAQPQYVWWTRQEAMNAKSRRCENCQHGSIWFVPVIAKTMVVASRPGRYHTSRHLPT